MSSGLVHLDHVLLEIGLGQSPFIQGAVLQIVLEGLLGSFQRRQQEVEGKHASNTQKLNHIERRHRQQIRNRPTRDLRLQVPLDEGIHKVGSNGRDGKPKDQQRRPLLDIDCQLHSNNDDDTGID